MNKIDIIKTEIAAKSRQLATKWTVNWDTEEKVPEPPDLSKLNPDEIADLVINKLKKHPKSLTDIRTDSIMDVMAKQLQIEIDKEILEKIKQLRNLK